MRFVLCSSSFHFIGQTVHIHPTHSRLYPRTGNLYDITTVDVENGMVGNHDNKKKIHINVKVLSIRKGRTGPKQP